MRVLYPWEACGSFISQIAADLQQDSFLLELIEPLTGENLRRARFRVCLVRLASNSTLLILEGSLAKARSLKIVILAECPLPCQIQTLR